MKNKEERLQKSKEKFRKKRKSQRRWVILVSIGTLVISIFLGFISEILLKNTNLYSAFALLIFIIFIGVIFDMIGIAVTAANETPFHSMAANKVRGAKQAVKLVKNAGQVSNFCNDVIGDICGIISGSIAAMIVYRVSKDNTFIDTGILSIVLGSLVAAFTVGGKALGKNIAILKKNAIVYRLALIIYWFKSYLGIGKQ